MKWGDKMADLICPKCGAVLDRYDVIDAQIDNKEEAVYMTYLYGCSNPDCDYWEHISFEAMIDLDNMELIERREIS